MCLLSGVWDASSLSSSLLTLYSTGSHLWTWIFSTGEFRAIVYRTLLRVYLPFFNSTLMDNVKLYILSSWTFTPDVENQHIWYWAALWLVPNVNCTPVSQHPFSVVVWLFSAFQSSQLTCMITVLHAVSRTTPRHTSPPSNVRMNSSICLSCIGTKDWNWLGRAWASSTLVGLHCGSVRVCLFACGHIP